jgi:hypothetical protein
MAKSRLSTLPRWRLLRTFSADENLGSRGKCAKTISFSTSRSTLSAFGVSAESFCGALLFIAKPFLSNAIRLGEADVERSADCAKRLARPRVSGPG